MTNSMASLIGSLVCLLVACPLLVIVGWFVVLYAYGAGLWVGNKIGSFFSGIAALFS